MCVCVCVCVRARVCTRLCARERAYTSAHIEPARVLARMRARTRTSAHCHVRRHRHTLTTFARARAHTRHRRVMAAKLEGLGLGAVDGGAPLSAAELQPFCHTAARAAAAHLASAGVARCVCVRVCVCE